MPSKPLRHFSATFTLAGLAGLAGWAPAAHADALPPGSTAATPGLTLAMAPRLAGTVVADESEPFAFMAGTGFVSGRVQHTVVRSVDGTLDFYWRISVDAGSTGRVDRLTVHGFRTEPSSSLIADHRPDALGNAPSDWARRSAGAGTTITFTLANGVGAGDVSKPLLLDTKDAKTSRDGKLVLGGMGGGASVSQATYVPLR